MRPEAKTKAWTLSRDELLEMLGVRVVTGLSDEEVGKRLKKAGPNRLREKQSRSAWRIFMDQFKSLVIGMLAAACIVSFAFGRYVEGLAVGAAIVINTAIGFVTEIRGVRAMEALRRLGRVTSKVRRNEAVEEIPADRLVPGDVILLEGGDIVTADLRLVETSRLQADESALTGESVPVGKSTDPLPSETVLAERANMVFKGTSITRGTGEGVVVSTGMETELGRISALTEEAENVQTPLEKRLSRLGRRLVWLTLAIVVMVAGTGILAGRDKLLMVETAIALAVAAIPEGLPIVATVALARGMWRMARRNAVISRLSAVETLGATSVIFSDKTGTLTKNRMGLECLMLPGEDEAPRSYRLEDGDFVSDEGQVHGDLPEPLNEALKIGVLCNNASLGTPEGKAGKPVGDPLEIALLEAGLRAGLEREELLKNLPEVREEAFDPEVMMMATYHEHDGRLLVAVKGSPERVIDASTRVFAAGGERPFSDAVREAWISAGERLASEGLRVLALAERGADGPDNDPYRDLALVGLVGLLDPPREEVAGAIKMCRTAGIDVVMVTGDQPLTARQIGVKLGLISEDGASIIRGDELADTGAMSDQELRRFREVSIFARVSPEQKLDIIEIYQGMGAVVAMTGDGVNDAPALKKADIGVAMGGRGTQVAREAADMVLKDDAFSTIGTAIAQGRVIFGNIRKFVIYLLSGNASKILAVAAASLMDLPIPILPLQILFLNMVIDVFPALALGMGEGETGIMERPPRHPDEPVLTGGHWFAIAAYAVIMGTTVLLSLGLALSWLGMDRARAVSVSFLTLAFARLWHIFNMRESGTRVFNNDIVRNRLVWGALALCAGLLLAAVFVPGLRDVLGVVNPGVDGWPLILGMSLIPLIVSQTLKETSLIRHSLAGNEWQPREDGI
jgi:Ca2+-transporting ATPase